MEIALLAVGRLKAGPESELCRRYLERAQAVGRGLGFRGFQVAELSEGRAPRPEERKAQEAEALLAQVAADDFLVLLDEGGDELTSAAFAALLRKRAEAGCRRACFAIGGADGHGDALRGRAGAAIAFGRMTWPHQLARILLAEQLYRAMTILSGHPYHRA
ncbi:23S rRNA (pseudouridine(1915)-N(3))-methyltransferase RlmH [Propylenella binzhouense]|uniref:Ribosomal RNA large subunit methyltransferase H n=1 Tax=Propylenella binzhouense TaxID=2555902 RepID=A0A964T593_9HYPH|nr:23S rRNA (pseudouridine(1915)-N(3))-methyltransferase RlmH [Propylenella binzhouense]MYZ48660.1 23S rRNA (pseudouridine(1915)-N(3))-methyltransferase RlmH [Propylenella binzhouense]